MSALDEITPEFEKKDIIFSASIGLCVVSDVVKLSADKSTPIPYYVLKSYYDKSKVAYIPVENHKVELRTLISEAEAVRRFEEIERSVTEDPDYVPDTLEVGELAYVYRITPEEFLKKAGVIRNEDQTEEPQA